MNKLEIKKIDHVAVSDTITQVAYTASNDQPGAYAYDGRSAAPLANEEPDYEQNYKEYRQYDQSCLLSCKNTESGTSVLYGKKTNDAGNQFRRCTAHGLNHDALYALIRDHRDERDPGIT